MKEMVLISGIGDFCQVYVTCKAEARCSLLTFRFKIINMTNFMIKNLALSFQSSPNLQVRPNQGFSHTVIGQETEANGSQDGFGGGSRSGLSQRESFEWFVTTRLVSLDELPQISLRLDVKATESCPESLLAYQTSTVPYRVSLLDLLIPDLSSSSHDQIVTSAVDPLYPFFFKFNSLPFALAKKCMAPVAKLRSPAETPELFRKLAKRLGSSMTVCLMSRRRLGLLAVTWQGERFAIQFVRIDDDEGGDRLCEEELMESQVFAGFSMNSNSL